MNVNAEKNTEMHPGKNLSGKVYFPLVWISDA